MRGGMQVFDARVESGRVAVQQAEQGGGEKQGVFHAAPWEGGSTPQEFSGTSGPGQAREGGRTSAGRGGWGGTIRG